MCIVPLHYHDVCLLVCVSLWMTAEEKHINTVLTSVWMLFQCFSSCLNKRDVSTHWWRRLKGTQGVSFPKTDKIFRNGHYAPVIIVYFNGFWSDCYWCMHSTKWLLCKITLVAKLRGIDVLSLNLSWILIHESAFMLFEILYKFLWCKKSQKSSI